MGENEFTRRSVVGATLGTAAVGGVRTTGAAAGTGDRAEGIGRAGRVRTAAPGEPAGFVRSWSTTHVQEGETEVHDVVASLGDGDALVAGETTSDQSRTNRRVWVGEFDDTGPRWTRTLRADGPSHTPRILARDDHYLVFWNGVNEDVQKHRVTKIGVDGNIRWQRGIETGFGGFRDVVETDDGYVVLDGDELRAFSNEFESTAVVELPPPSGYELGRGNETIVPVSDGYVVTGRVVGEETKQALWAVKVDAVDGSSGAVQWTEAYGFDVNAFGGFGARLTGDDVVLAGTVGGDADDPAAVRIGPDGQETWRATCAVDADTVVNDVHVGSSGIRTVCRFDYDLGVVTFDEAGAVVAQWHGSGDEELFEPNVDALGDGRFVVGGSANDSDVDSRGFVARLQPNQPPSPSVAVSPSDPNATERVTFDASATTDPDTNVGRYEWDLSGDGSFGTTGVTASTRFRSAGTHEVVVRAVDEYGAVGEQVLSVSVGENTAPSASLSVGVASPVVGDSVPFEVTDVSDAESSVASVSWTVDGEHLGESGREVSVGFDAAGDHEVAATLTDTGGKSTTVDASVTVNPSPTTDGDDATGQGDASNGAGGGGANAGSDGGSSPIPGFGVGAAATAVGVVAALANRLGDDDAA
jgi:hypothetical protein